MTSLSPPQDICLLAESRQLWQVDPECDHCTELSEYETIKIFLSRYCRFSLGTRTGICFNDFNQDILLTHTQALRVLEINRGFSLLQPCVAEVVGWVFSVSQRDSKHFCLLLLSPALPFGFCPPAIIWTIPVYGSSKTIKQYYAHRLSSASNMQRLPPRRWYRNVSELHRNTISTALWTCVWNPFSRFAPMCWTQATSLSSPSAKERNHWQRWQRHTGMFWGRDFISCQAVTEGFTGKDIPRNV